VRGRDEQRALPDYDGRAEPTSVGDALLWVPRVVLFPAWVASEFVVRRPLGWLTSTAEREHWPTLILNFFTFGERQGGILPTWLIDYGLRPSVGVYAFWNDFLVEENDLRLRLAWGGTDTWLARLTDRFPLGPGTLALNTSYESRPDNLFYGIGDQVDARSRHFRSAVKGGLSYEVPWIRSSYGRIGVGLREVKLDGDRRCCEDPSVNERVRAGTFAAPAGMDQVYDVADQALTLVFDSRWPRSPEELELASDYVPPPGDGLRLGLRGDLAELTGQSLAVGSALASSWLHYGASFGGYLDLTGEQRTLSATVLLDFVDPLGSGAVPITDLVSLGGERPLQGFLPGRFVDRSAAALRLEYRWPVAVWLDGELLYESGNVFGEGLSGFDLDDFRSSFGFGLSAVGNQDHNFQMLLAVGTTSFRNGAELDSFRFVLGTTAGF
jgi:hypothetical protein